MADEKLTDLSAETAVDADDVMYHVDVSDTTDDPAGTSMKVTISELLKGAIRFFQVQDDGSTGQLTTGTPTDLAGMWDTPSINTGDFSWNGTTGVLTVNADGIIEVEGNVTGYNEANNRNELKVQLYKNGSTVLVEDSQYASRNNTQRVGSAYVHGFKDSCTSGDTYRLRVYDAGVGVTIGASQIAGDTYLGAKLYK